MEREGSVKNGERNVDVISNGFFANISGIGKVNSELVFTTNSHTHARNIEIPVNLEIIAAVRFYTNNWQNQF